MNSKTTESKCSIKKAEVSEAAITIQQVVILIISILIIIVIFLIPTILYYSDKPSKSVFPSFGIDFETCLVSFVISPAAGGYLAVCRRSYHA